MGSFEIWQIRASTRGRFIYLLSRYLGLQCFQLTLKIMLRRC